MRMNRYIAALLLALGLTTTIVPIALATFPGSAIGGVSSGGGGVVGDYDAIPSSPNADNLEMVGGALNGWTFTVGGTVEAGFPTPLASVGSGSVRYDIATLRDSWLFVQPYHGVFPFISKNHTFATNEYVVIRTTFGLGGGSGAVSDEPYITFRVKTDSTNYVYIRVNRNGFASVGKSVAGVDTTVANCTSATNAGFPLVAQYAMIAKAGTSYTWWLAQVSGQWQQCGSSGTTYASTLASADVVFSAVATNNKTMGLDYVRFFTNFPL